jgi:hypothetical protein
MAAVFDEDLSSIEKLVLLAMSDHADDAGENCFPSVPRIARKCSMSRRGVQQVLRRLQVKGKIRPVGHRPHGTVEYLITSLGGEYGSRGERTAFGGEGRTMFARGANGNARGGEYGSAESSLTVNQPPKEKSISAPSEHKPKRSTPLLDAFELDQEMILFAVDRGLDAQEEFAGFCDHHRSKGTRYQDWKAAWRNWVRNAKKFNGGSKGVNRAKERTSANIKAAAVL